MNQANLMDLMQDGGFVMWLLLGFSLAAAAVTIQRVLVIRRARGKAAPLLAMLATKLGRGLSTTKAAEACRRHASSVGRLLASGLARSDNERDLLADHLEAVALAELRRLGHGLGVLAAIATTAPLLGFLGTVTGMMASFGSIVGHGMARPDLVALGIQEALTTTAAGLIVAVPTQLAYQALRGKVAQIEGELEAAANGLLDLLRHRAT